MIEFTQVERENKVYVNENAIVLDRNTITAAELLELAGFSSLVYDIYLAPKEESNNNKRKKKVNNKPLAENNQIKMETGMHFNAVLK